MQIGSPGWCPLRLSRLAAQLKAASFAGNTRNMTPIGNGKRPACHLSGRSAKRRAPLDDTALKARVEGVRGSAQEEAEDATPLMQQPRYAQHWCACASCSPSLETL